MKKYFKIKSRFVYIFIVIALFFSLLAWFKYFDLFGLNQGGGNYSIFAPLAGSIVLLFTIVAAVKREYIIIEENELFIPGLLKSRYKFTEISGVERDKGSVKIYDNGNKVIAKIKLANPDDFIIDLNKHLK